MIRLHRPAIPEPLAAAAPQAERALWDAWQRNEPPCVNPAIYGHSAVKQALRNAQHDKCAYCETLNPTSHDVVEHFRPKQGWRQTREDPLNYPEYFWLSYTWENLLFACDQCNDGGHKQNLFPLERPEHRATAVDRDIGRESPLILDPYGKKDPEKHIAWNRDVPRPRNSSRWGRATIATFKLDENSLLLRSRRKYLNNMEAMLCLVEALPPDANARVAAKGVFESYADDAGPWAAMTRANLGVRIAAL
jgi:uncharacterized protein (TIGR02646 family)